jgi:hypothetical protein
MKKLLSFTLIFLAFLSCKRNDIIEFHPMDERYPYHASEIQSVHFAKKILNDEDHYLFNTKSFNGAFNVQKIISTEMPFVDTDYLTFGSLSDRLLLLDRNNNSLHNFHLFDEKWSQIASQGRGPGEIMFSSDITNKDNLIYIASKNLVISIFECEKSEDCFYSSSIQLDKIQSSSVTVNEDGFFVMGQSSNLFNGNEIDEKDLNSIYKVDINGNVEESFGEIYDINKHWMLLTPFGEGKIRSTKRNGLIQYYDLIPEIYFLEGQKVNKKIVINDFLLSKRKYNNRTQELFINFEDWSSIEDIKVINDDLAILIIKNRRNRTVNDMSVRWDKSKDVYGINLTNGQSNYLGSIDLDKENIWFTDDFLIQLKDQEQLNIYTYKLR